MYEWIEWVSEWIIGIMMVDGRFLGADANGANRYVMLFIIIIYKYILM